MGVIRDRWRIWERQQIIDELALTPTDLPSSMATDAEVAALASTNLTDSNLIARHKGVWTTNTSWLTGDIVQITSAVANGYPLGLWRCTTTHLGGMTFSGTSAGYWVKLAGDLDSVTASGAFGAAVAHGTNAATARPVSPLPVTWSGTVAPTNAITNDRWYDQGNDQWKRWNGTTWNPAGGVATIGASGDTTGVTDTANINAALAAYDCVRLASPFALPFYTKTLLVTGNGVTTGRIFHIPSGVVVQQVAGYTGVMVTNASPGTDSFLNIIIDGTLTAYYNQASNTGGVHLIGAQYSKISGSGDITFTNVAGVLLKGYGIGSSGDSMHCIVRDVTVSNIVSGCCFRVSQSAGGSKPDSTKFIGTLAHSNVGTAYKVDEAADTFQRTDGVYFIGCSSMETPTVIDAAGQGIGFVGCRFECNTTPTMTVLWNFGPSNSTSRDCFMTGCEFSATTFVRGGSGTLDGVRQTSVSWGDIGTQHDVGVPYTHGSLPSTSPITVAQNVSDRAFVNNNTSPASGTLTLSGINLPAWLRVGGIAYIGGGGAMSGQSHWWYGLYDKSRNQLAVTADQGAAAWTPSTLNRLAVATTAAGAATFFVTTYSGLHYTGIVVVATTIPALFCTSSFSTAISGINPATAGTSDTGQTTVPAFPHQAAGMATIAQRLYASITS